MSSSKNRQVDRKKTFWKSLGGAEKLGIFLFGLVMTGAVLGSGVGSTIFGTSSEVSSKSRNGKAAEESLISRLNPFSSTPTPTPVSLSKEFIYAGDRLLSVVDANATAAPPVDLAVWRPSTGTWWVLGGSGSQSVTENWGTSGDKVAPGDYDGDGKTDFAVWRKGDPSASPPTASTWYIKRSSDGVAEYHYFGADGDLVASADFDGDGKTDPALYRQSAGSWYIKKSTTGVVETVAFGNSDDVPVPADFDGDGMADVAVFRDANSSPTTFYSLNSSNGALYAITYGITGDVPVVGDYDGDGKGDHGVRRGATWYIYQSSNTQTASYTWGLSTDIAVPNDYDGDAKVDIAVWRPADSTQGAGDAGNWYIYNSSDSTTRQESWGAQGDTPVPAYFRRYP